MTSLDQHTADQYFIMPKIRKDNQIYYYPDGGSKISVPLLSKDGHTDFDLDIHRGRIKISKHTYQNRTKQTVILVRLDISGPPHQNPDGVVIPSPHLHRYREGYGDKWAEPIPQGVFSNIDDHYTTLQDFMSFLNIIDPPNIQRGLI